MKSILQSLFGKNQSAKNNHRDVRRLLIEPLEERALLAVSAADFNAIRAAYPGFEPFREHG